jgi:hypothetical protein
VIPRPAKTVPTKVLRRTEIARVIFSPFWSI